METPIDILIAKRIREKLCAHSEPYDMGAWEHFLARKKKKRRAVIFWHGKIAAGLLLLLSSVFFWKDTSISPAKKNAIEIQKEAPIVNKNKRPVVSSESDQDIPEKDVFREEQTDTAVQTDDPVQGKSNEKNPTDAVTRITKGKKLKEKALVRNHVNKKDTSNVKRKIAMVAQDIVKRSSSQLIASHVKLNKNEKDDIIQTDSTTSIKNDPFLEEKAMELPEEHGVNRLAFGLVFGSSYNELSKSTATGNGLSARVGIMTDMRLFDNLSILSGITVARQGIASDRDLPVLAMGGISQTESETVQLWSIDVPLDLKYTFPTSKKSLFISAGLSSLITFNQRTDTDNILTREVITIQEVDGIPVTQTTTETITTSTSETSGRTQFYPVGILNLSAGFSQPISEKLRLEIAPFFKYPFQDLTSDDLRFTEMGIQLRMYLQSKKHSKPKD